MGILIEWLKGNAAPNDYVEVSETNPLPVKTPSELVHSGSINGKVNLSSIPAVLKIGATSLSGRHTLTVYNDASAIVYVGFNSDVSSDDGLQLSSGIGVTFNFDPDELVEATERILKANTDYIIQATNSGAQNSTLYTSILFYESGN